MSAQLTIHDSEDSEDVTEFKVCTRTYDSDERYLIFSARQGGEEFKYFLHITKGLSPDYVRAIAAQFGDFSARLLEEADNLSTNDDEEE